MRCIEAIVKRRWGIVARIKQRTSTQNGGRHSCTWRSFSAAHENLRRKLCSIDLGAVCRYWYHHLDVNVLHKSTIKAEFQFISDHKANDNRMPPPTLAPAISIVDKAIVSNASGVEPLLPCLVNGIKTLFTNPVYFIKQPSFLLIWGVYGGTYIVANSVEVTFRLSNSWYSSAQ